MVQQYATTQWAYEHYFVYLHLCIADSDCVIRESEFDKIRNEVLPAIDAERGRKLIKDVYIEFLAHSEFQKKELIRSLASKYLRTPSIRQKVLANLKACICPDDDCEERAMYNFIENAIGPDR